MDQAWNSAVLSAIRRYCSRHQTRLIRRKQFLAEELKQMAEDAETSGKTPEQTVSRVFQQFRDNDILIFVERGKYLFIDGPLRAEDEDLSEAALDAAIERDKLRISSVATNDEQVIARRRKGQARLRKYTLSNYDARCALCDVSDQELLVTSHIARWSDDRNAQGHLSNVLCLCRMHDALFEYGYITLADDLRVLLPRSSKSSVVQYLQSTHDRLRPPKSHPPNVEYLRQHRQRVGNDV